MTLVNIHCITAIIIIYVYVKRLTYYSLLQTLMNYSKPTPHRIPTPPTATTKKPPRHQCPDIESKRPNRDDLDVNPKRASRNAEVSLGKIRFVWEVWMIRLVRMEGGII